MLLSNTCTILKSKDFKIAIFKIALIEIEPQTALSIAGRAFITVRSDLIFFVIREEVLASIEGVFGSAFFKKNLRF